MRSCCVRNHRRSALRSAFWVFWTMSAIADAARLIPDGSHGTTEPHAGQGTSTSLPMLPSSTSATAPPHAGQGCSVISVRGVRPGTLPSRRVGRPADPPSDR